jgi:hypothetical protein
LIVIGLEEFNWIRKVITIGEEIVVIGRKGWTGLEGC